MIRVIWALFLVSILIGCGGGGGGNSGPTVRVTGFVIDVASGGPLATQPTVQIGTATVKADAGDGSFAINAPKGATTVLVSTSAYGTVDFTVAALNTDTDLGSLWVGPQTVSVTGVVRDAETNKPISGATVTFGGRVATTNGQGAFTVLQVAYIDGGAFDSIQGSINADGYFANSFTSGGAVPSSGSVDVGDLLLLSIGNGTPPGGPYNLWGRVSPSASAPGTVVTLSQSGNALHQFTVGQDGRYFFWVPAGAYDLVFANGNLNASASVTLKSSNQLIEKDVTLQ